MPALFAARHDPRHPRRRGAAGADLLASRKHGFGARTKDEPRPPFWSSLREAFWGLMAPVLILGGMRAGWFTPTEAAVVAVFYGLFVGFVIYRSLTLRDVYEMLVEFGRDLRADPDRRGAGLDLRLGGLDARRGRPVAARICRLRLGNHGTVLALLIVLLIMSACSSTACRPS